jgi:dCMP deaminase
MGRISKDEYYLQIAEAVAKRSICIEARRGFGAIIVNNDTIVSTGYAGPARGVINCNEVGGCARNILKQEHYDPYQYCPSVHAEENAIVNAARHGSKVWGGTMYLIGINSNGKLSIGIPCARCRRILINAGIKKIVTKNETNKIVKYDVSDWIEEDSKTYINNIEKIKKK